MAAVAKVIFFKQKWKKNWGKKLIIQDTALLERKVLFNTFPHVTRLQIVKWLFYVGVHSNHILGTMCFTDLMLKIPHCAWNLKPTSLLGRGVECRKSLSPSSRWVVTRPPLVSSPILTTGLLDKPGKLLQHDLTGDHIWRSHTLPSLVKPAWWHFEKVFLHARRFLCLSAPHIWSRTYQAVTGNHTRIKGSP